MKFLFYLVSVVVSITELDTRQINFLQEHGCHCSRLQNLGTGVQTWAPSSTPVDALDEACREVIKKHNKNRKESGSCIGKVEIPPAFVQKNFYPITDKCERDTIKIDNSFLRKVFLLIESVETPILGAGKCQQSHKQLLEEIFSSTTDKTSRFVSETAEDLLQKIESLNAKIDSKKEHTRWAGTVKKVLHSIFLSVISPFHIFA